METIAMLPLWASSESAHSEGLPYVIVSSSAAVVLAAQSERAPVGYDASICHPDPSDRFLPIGLAAGVAIAAAVGVVDQITQVIPPTYEARVTLAAQGEQAVHLDLQTQLEVMESPALLEPVVAQLQSRSVDITYDGLLQSLTIEAVGETFDIRYRHPDADMAEAVIEQVSSTYLSHGHTCRQSACRGLQFVEAQIPQVQQRVRADQDQLRRLYGSGPAPSQQAKLAAARTADVKRQSIDINQRLSAAYKARAVLQDRVGLSQTPARTLLQRDAPYQQRLQELRQVEQQIAAEFGRPQANSQSLRALHQRHSAISAQLNQTAQGSLRRFLDNPRGPVDPVFQQPIYGELLQKLVGIVHQIEVLELRQKTLAQVEATLATERRRITGLLRQYGAAEQQLLANSSILQNYIDRREQLQDDADLELLSWQVISPPEVISPEEADAGGLWHSRWPSVSPYYIGAIAGLAAGAAVFARRRQKVIEGEFV
ncbi:MAG: hypothetical protein ACFB5Z_01950 [Elainellaceae cyanobacterium]